MKNYFAFATDHTGSMSHIARQAAADYNSLIESVKSNASKHNIDTIVSHVKIGHSDGFHSTTTAPTVRLRNSSLAGLKPIHESEYDTRAGSTRLFDTVVECINILKSVPDYNDADVSFVVMITTDGGDNASRTSGTQLARMINELQSTDKWTFVFRVPRDGVRTLTSMGIPSDNILAWEQSAQGVQAATAATSSAMDSFYQARTTGTRATRSFYANMASVKPEQVKAVLEDVSTKVTLYPVAQAEHDMQIRDFVEKRTGKALLKGAAFYQLTKSEDKVQASKKICIRDKQSNAIYYGTAARQLLGIPLYDDIRLKPDNLGQYDVFIQSTSVNRKVQAGSHILYWADVGVAYKEGPSAR